MKLTAAVINVLIAVAVAAYWRNEMNGVKLMHTDSFYQQVTQADCSVVHWNERELNNGFTVAHYAVHVCEDEYSRNGLCYFTPIQRCCFHSGLEKDLVSHSMTVGSQKIKVSILYVGKTDVCVHFDPHNSIDLCSTGLQCVDLGCLNPVQVCRNNTKSSCDPSGCLACKQGYKKMSCCDCEDNFLKDNGVCKFVCQSNCRGDGGDCSSCAHPYTGAPFCCDCVLPYVKDGGVGGACICPNGYYDIGGTCERICMKNTIPCANPPCCKNGYKGPLCCECIFNEERSFFMNNGHCERICKENAIKHNCNADTGCSQCEDSFKSPNCCECMEPLKLVDGVCRSCGLNEVLVDGRCKAICELNIIQDSCNETACRCRTGYLPNDCCRCAHGYIMEGDQCMLCPPGTTPDSTQTKCICDSAKGRQIFVNGKCMSVCDSNAVACSESNCTCQKFFAFPDCCKCSSGDEPENGICPVPCIENQNIVIVIDRSTGIGQFELWGVMYAIELLISALLKGKRNLAISVMSYATSHQDTQLLDLSPQFFTNRKEVDLKFCSDILEQYERNMRNSERYPRPRGTYSGWTLHLLKNIIKKDKRTAVISFLGTLSNGNPLGLIAKSIREMKARVGRNNVQFFAAGFEAENWNANKVKRMRNYYAEVKALGDNNALQNIVVNVQKDAAGFVRALANMLYYSGVLCKHQRDKIISQNTTSTINSRFYDYETCCVITTTPCIILQEFNYVCLNESVPNAVRTEEDTGSSLLSVVKALLNRLTS